MIYAAADAVPQYIHKATNLLIRSPGPPSSNLRVFLVVGTAAFMNSSAHTPNARPRSSPRPSPRSGNTPRHRPATIAELADRARDDLWDPSKGVKYWLKTGESHRRAGKGFFEVGDLESAFVEYAKAATIVLEKLPLHRDYATTLTTDQRHNLGLVSSL